MGDSRIRPFRAWAIRSGFSKITEARQLGDAARNQGNWTVAVDQYRVHLSMRPHDFAIWVQLGHALKETGRLAEALAAYDNALKLSQSDADLLVNIGHLHKLMLRTEEAATYYRRSAEKDRNPAAVAELAKLGVNLPPPRMQHGMDGAGSAASRRVRLISVKSLDRKRGNQARDARDWRAAVKHYRSHLAAKPKDFAIWVQLGHALKESGQIDEALAAYSEGLRLDPLNADLHLNLGHLHRVRGDQKSAIDAYRQSARLDGNRHAIAELQTLGAFHPLLPGRSEQPLSNDGPRRMTASDPAPISVVIPTFNRVALLQQTLMACDANAGGVSLQYVVVNDGSTDETASYLVDLAAKRDDLTVVQIDNSGPGEARNIGAKSATHDILLFIGDDIRPANDEFFRAHSAFHGRRTARNEAMLGKIIWPSSGEFSVNHVMRHIQGRGGQQFGYAEMIPYRWYDWRFFYTSNVSVKKTVVDNWASEGFSDQFKLYGYEDIEFAYRLEKGPNRLKLFYDPSSVCAHFHPYNFDRFVERQLNCGRMANVFSNLHPDVRESIGVSWMIDMLRSNRLDGMEGIADQYAIFEGLRAWINTLDRRGVLGNDGGHDELLAGFFDYAFSVGFISAAAGSTDNIGAALGSAFERFLIKMRRVISTEIGDQSQVANLIYPAHL